MEAVVWSDYLCPWCYLGRDRTRLLRSLGVTVVARPYELHPDIGPEGRDVRPGGRLAGVYATIGAACAEVGMPFRAPTRVPNTRRAHELAAAVAELTPEALGPLDDALFRAAFVDGLALDDEAVLVQLATEAGVDVDRAWAAVTAGVGAQGLQASMDAAHEAGVTATPAWLVDQRFLIPGVQPRETVERWVRRLQGSVA